MVKKKQTVKELEEKVKKLENNWKRAVADYRNLKKRNEKERANFAIYANQRLLEAILPVRDSLVQARKQFDKSDGIHLILKQLDEILESEGVEKIEVREGDKFNPTTMEAIETIESEDKEKKNTVAKMFRTGFKYKERILRPVEVKVYI